MRNAKRDVSAKKLAEAKRDARWSVTPAPSLRKGDVVLVEAGDVVPADGEVIEGVASVNESAITGKVPRSSERRAETEVVSQAGRRYCPTGLSFVSA